MDPRYYGRLAKHRKRKKEGRGKRGPLAADAVATKGPGKKKKKGVLKDAADLQAVSKREEAAG